MAEFRPKSFFGRPLLQNPYWIANDSLDQTHLCSCLCNIGKYAKYGPQNMYTSVLAHEMDAGTDVFMELALYIP